MQTVIDAWRRLVERIRRDDPEWDARDVWLPLGVATAIVVTLAALGLGVH
ncbi:MAG: hypothetical protein AB7U73_08310 [Pirellulales bacterium]